MHGYKPTHPLMATGLIIKGKGIRQGVEIPLTRLIDIGPTIASIMGLHFDSATGLPLVGIFENKK